MTWDLQELDIDIVRNDTIDIDIQLVDIAGNDVPASTFASGLCQVRKKRNKAPILTFDTTDTSMVISDGNINLNGGDSDQQEDYIYDIQLTLPSGQVVTPIGGKWTFIDDVTL